MTDDDGYVHRPGGSDDGPEPTASGFGSRGWLLVAAVVLATLVIPGVIYLFPATPGAAGLPFLVAMLALPLVPAVLLGLTAVWSMTAATAGSGDDAPADGDARTDADDAFRTDTSRADADDARTDADDARPDADDARTDADDARTDTDDAHAGSPRADASDATTRPGDDGESVE